MKLFSQPYIIYIDRHSVFIGHTRKREWQVVLQGPWDYEQFAESLLNEISSRGKEAAILVGDDVCYVITAIVKGERKTWHEQIITQLQSQVPEHFDQVKWRYEVISHSAEGITLQVIVLNEQVSEVLEKLSHNQGVKVIRWVPLSMALTHQVEHASPYVLVYEGLQNLLVLNHNNAIQFATTVAELTDLSVSEYVAYLQDTFQLDEIPLLIAGEIPELSNTPHQEVNLDPLQGFASQLKQKATPWKNLFSQQHPKIISPTQSNQQASTLSPLLIAMLVVSMIGVLSLTGWKLNLFAVFSTPPTEINEEVDSKLEITESTPLPTPLTPNNIEVTIQYIDPSIFDQDQLMILLQVEGFQDIEFEKISSKGPIQNSIQYDPAIPEEILLTLRRALNSEFEFAADGVQSSATNNNELTITLVESIIN